MGAIISVGDSMCESNCSGRGDCHNGICICQVEFAGGTCEQSNTKFYVAFSTVFYIISAVSLLQLVLCINSEFSRQKPRSLVRAFRVTTQKALYFFICVATALRGFYFSLSSSFHSSSQPMNNHNMSAHGNVSDSTIELSTWVSSSLMMSAYYPLLLSGSSLVVCFWAEVFHLHNVGPEKPGFLSKSFTGFVFFNVVTYSLLLAELVLLHFSDATQDERALFLSIFNSLYAVLMLIVVVFFLIYGVEVYFKLRGAFVQGKENCRADTSQLKQSQFGLVSQAVLLLLAVIFIFSDVLGSFWKDKVPVFSRNTHEIMFRIVELGVALWFPCVLWNCVRPEALWILNPRKIIRKFEGREMQSLVDRSTGVTLSPSTLKLSDCWICYDPGREDAGPLIQPCSCKGDVSSVHHECLKTWLMESNSSPEAVRCKVCNDEYMVERGDVHLLNGLTISHWMQTAAIFSVMASAAGSVFLMVRLFDHVYIKTISVGSAILVEYICLRFLGFNVISAYNRAKFSAIKIAGRNLVSHSSLSASAVNHETGSLVTNDWTSNNAKPKMFIGSVNDVSQCPSPVKSFQLLKAAYSLPSVSKL